MSNKILIGKDDSLFIKALAENLEKASIDAAFCENTRGKILEALEKDSYDLVFIHTMSEKISVAELVDEIHSRFEGIKILVSIYNEAYSAVDRLTISSRVKCAAMPMSVGRLTEIVYRLLEPNKSDAYPYIADFLYLLGLRRKYDGFSYLCSAISLCLDDPTRINAIVKRIYAEVGAENGVDKTIVDRSLRYLSKAVYKDGLVPVLTCGQFNKALTNYELICSAGDRFVNSRATKNFLA